MPHFADGVYQYGGMPDDVGTPFGMNSKYFFVDTESGSNGNDGLTPAAARASITAALALCESNRRDTVYVLRWGTDNSETWPIPMNKAGVSLIGMRGGGPNHSSWAYIVGTESSAIFAVSAANCTIKNFLLQGYDTAEDMITFSSYPNRTGIIGNFFATCAGAIGGTTAALSLGYHSSIEDNFFSAQVSDFGILQYNPAHLMIRNNIFSRVGGSYAIDMNRPGRVSILNNIFIVTGDTDGAAIRLRGATTYGIIDGNRANYAKAAMTNNPYADNAPGGTPNCWLVNYKGSGVTYPATL